MSKERLEDHTHMAVRINEYEKLKEQLEKENEALHDNLVLLNNNHTLLSDDFIKVEQQNKRYRERLKYLLEEAKDHKKKGIRIQHWALIKDLEKALEGEE